MYVYSVHHSQQSSTQVGAKMLAIGGRQASELRWQVGVVLRSSIRRVSATW